MSTEQQHLSADILHALYGGEGGAVGVDVRHSSELSYAEFVGSYMAPNIPVLIEVRAQGEAARLCAESVLRGQAAAARLASITLLRQARVADGGRQHNHGSATHNAATPFKQKACRRWFSGTAARYQQKILVPSDPRDSDAAVAGGWGRASRKVGQLHGTGCCLTAR